MVRDLRTAIEASGLSYNALAQASGTTSGALSRFMRGARTLTLVTAGKIAEALSLELRERQD